MWRESSRQPWIGSPVIFSPTIMNSRCLMSLICWFSQSLVGNFIGINVLLIAPFVYKTLCRHIVDLFSFGSSESLSQATYTRDLTSLLLASKLKLQHLITVSWSVSVKHVLQHPVCSFIQRCIRMLLIRYPMFLGSTVCLESSSYLVFYVLHLILYSLIVCGHGKWVESREAIRTKVTKIYSFVQCHCSI